MQLDTVSRSVGSLVAETRSGRSEQSDSDARDANVSRRSRVECFGNYDGMQRSFQGYIQFIDDYSHEPVGDRRHDMLNVQKEQPFNAEPKPHLLIREHRTPTALFYVRSHGSVPACPDATRFRLQVDVGLALGLEGTGRNEGAQGRGVHQWSLIALQQQFQFTEVEACLQCAGNRRTELVERTKRPVKGVGWHQAAIGNALWGGFLLADVLRATLQRAGVDERQLEVMPSDVFIELEGADWVPEEEWRRKATGRPPPGYMASLSWSMVMGSASKAGAVPPVLLATHMNGAPLTADHGYPLRCVVPGVYGARSVKWLWRLSLRRGHSDGFFVERDYKVFSPATEAAYVNWNAAPPLMEVNVQCAACVPSGRIWKLWRQQQQRQVYRRADQASMLVPVWGYAYSGGGRRIIRVDVSGDSGASWTVARLIFHSKNVDEHGLQPISSPTRTAESDCYTPGLERPTGNADNNMALHLATVNGYAWCRWYAALSIRPPCEIWCRAVDEAANTQPDDVRGCWNFRGVAHNSTYRIQVDVSDGPQARL
ncbi:hypothetical protein CCYA_CCYA02G0525 [Cyanidiococcus yangmingshanensis]|nr:hypothetical protein CCYA_CCYA02G0525 [Cyanidiococcus yangmingshanensis]